MLRYDLTRVELWCRPLLLAYIASEVALAVHNGFALDHAYAIEAGTRDSAAIDHRAALLDTAASVVHIIYMVILSACFIAGGIWIYRASYNARQIDPNEARIRPGWAVGWFAVPIANLFMPCRAMRQTWNSSISPGGTIDAPVPAYFLVWWLAWVLSSLITNASSRMWARDDSLDMYITTAWMDLATALLGIVSGALFLRIIRKTTAAQATLQGLDEVFE